MSNDTERLKYLKQRGITPSMLKEIERAQKALDRMPASYIKLQQQIAQSSITQIQDIFNRSSINLAIDRTKDIHNSFLAPRQLAKYNKNLASQLAINSNVYKNSFESSGIINKLNESFNKHQNLFNNVYKNSFEGSRIINKFNESFNKHQNLYNNVYKNSFATSKIIEGYTKGLSSHLVADTSLYKGIFAIQQSNKSFVSILDKFINIGKPNLRVNPILEVTEPLIQSILAHEKKRINKAKTSKPEELKNNSSFEDNQKLLDAFSEIKKLSTNSGMPYSQDYIDKNTEKNIHKIFTIYNEMLGVVFSFIILSVLLPWFFSPITDASNKFLTSHLGEYRDKITNPVVSYISSKSKNNSQNKTHDNEMIKKLGDSTMSLGEDLLELKLFGKNHVLNPKD